MTTNASRLQRALALFEAVADLPADERKRQLDEACTDDPELRRTVEAMLLADRTADSLPTEPSAWLDGSSSPPVDDNEDISALRFGPWQVTGVLGRGGMGAVYRVERADGAYQQSAALKRIRMGLDTGDAQQRFLRERQILATLRHPNIARLIDGGVAGETPYFAMELVEGERIDRWCDARKLNLRDRAQLFLQVLDAVSEAHRNLIVHRDLKPSNVLVDDGGQAHLLDFGIAQLLEEDADATQTQHRAFTPDFASPEQLRAEPVTTASDVYQLGVMLYLLICGRHPFGMEADTPWHRKIALLDRPAIPPSRALDGNAAAERGGTQKTLSKQISGDLEAILLRAIARVPSARYPSVDAFRSDLRAWLDGYRVQARLPSRSERLMRMIRRNRLLFAAGTAVIAALTVGLGVALLEARRAHRSETVALQQQSLAEHNARQSAAIQETFERMLMHAMAVDGGRKTTVREMADGAMRSVDTKSGRGDEARISLLLDLIHVYTVAGQKDGAREMLQKVRPQAMAMAAEQPVFAYRIKALEADLLEETDPDKIPRYRDAYAFAGKWIGKADESSFESVRTSIINYLYSLDWRGMSIEQNAIASQIHAMTLARYGEQNPRTVQMAMSHARALAAIGRHRDADRMLQQQLVLTSSHFGASGQLAISSQSMLIGNEISIDGRWPRAESEIHDLLQKYRDRRADVLGVHKVKSRIMLVRLLQRERRDTEARTELARIESDLAMAMGDDIDEMHLDLLVLQSEQAWNEGNASKSLEHAEAGLLIPWKPLAFDDASSHTAALFSAARAQAALGRCKAATRRVAEALQIRAGFTQRLDFTSDWTRAADIERVCSQPDAALKLARLASGNVSRLSEPDSWRIGTVQLALARALVAANQPGSASAYQRADTAFARLVPATHPYRVAIATEYKTVDLPHTSEAPW
ncbi:serine/threonine protein kinase [Solilutibacter silvestris]|uniref:serine/threonine protein kinase n=1 Tax=Solilutibacter silvestris TaxID=1645665 RepID=UPI003D32C505